MYMVLYQQLAKFIPRRLLESAGDEEGRRWRTPCTSRRPDDVYGALSAASTVVVIT